MERGRIALFGCILVLGLASCTVEHDWYPTGKVEVLDRYTLESYVSVAPTATVVYRVSNDGDSEATIVATTISLELVTDIHTYHRTVVDTSRIRFGHHVYGLFETVLREEGEQLEEVTITDVCFE